MDAVTWLEQKGSHVDLGMWTEDGTTYACAEGFFRGRIPYRMIQEVKEIAKRLGGTYNREILNWRDGNRHYSFSTGAYKSTVCNVRFGWGQEIPV